jgi:hypothetical protein
MFYEQQQAITMFNNEHVLLVNTQRSHLHSQGDLDSSAKGEVGRVYYKGVDMFLIWILTWYVIVRMFKW